MDVPVRQKTALRAALYPRWSTSHLFHLHFASWSWEFHSKKDLKLHLPLQQLCAVPEIANSEEMQEFLALNTDARIAFVKKPFIVSRIDKVDKWESVYLNQ